MNIPKLNSFLKYHNHTLQTSPWYREEEPQNINIQKTPRRTSKQGNQLSLPLQNDCKLERTRSNAYQNNDQTQNQNENYLIKKLSEYDTTKSLQTNTRHRYEEPHIINTHKTPGRQPKQSATCSLYLVKIIVNQVCLPKQSPNIEPELNSSRK